MASLAAGMTLASAGLLLTASAPQERVPHDLKGRVPVAPVSCIDPGQGNGPAIIDGPRLLYRDGGRVWVTAAIDGCPALHPGVILVIEPLGRQLCRNDRFQVIERDARIPSGYCHFTTFTPWVNAAR